VLRPVQERLGLLDGPRDETLLYLWRGGIRSVRDQERLIGLLGAEARRAGLRLDVRRGGEDMDADLIRTRRARLLVGPHGGAFANLAFARPGAGAIEILPYAAPLAAGGEVRSMYWGLAHAAGLDYWAVEPQQFDFDEPDMVVDFDLVIETVRAALM
jgi:capsular polysaccharide biosynthesis protein